MKYVSSFRAWAEPLLGALVLAAIVPASGCAKRSGHQVSSAKVFADDPHVALDGSGHGVGIWIETTPNLFGVDGGGEVVVIEFESGVGFRRAETLYQDLPSRSPRVGMHGDGSARAAWVTDRSDGLGSDFAVTAAFRTPEGDWTIELVQEGIADVESLSLATNRRGDALLAWCTADQVFFARAEAGTGFHAPIEIGVQDAGEHPPAVRAALGPDGEGVIVRSHLAGSTFGVVAHLVPPGSNPGPATAIDDGLSCQLGGNPEDTIAAVVDRDAFVTTAWIASDGTDDSAFGPVAVQRFDPTLGSWGSAALLSAPDAYSSQVQLGCDLSGTVRAQWVDSATHFKAVLEPGTGWSTSENGNLYSLGALAVAPNGCAISIGSYSIFTQETCYADLMPPARGWTGLIEVPEGGYGGDADIEESGLAIALSLIAFDEEGLFASEQIVVANVWHAPLADLSVRGTPQAGQPTRLDARSTEIRTTDASVARVEWDFESDGHVDEVFDDASGLQTEHVYPVSGTYQARVRVTDDWGYSDTADAAVEVRDGGGGGGGGGDGPPWLLEVDVTGGGRVVSGDDSNGDGTPDIDAPGDDSELYPDDHFAFLRPEPPDGIVFIRWEGLTADDMDYGAEGCTIKMVTHRSVRAVFGAE